MRFEQTEGKASRASHWAICYCLSNDPNLATKSSGSSGAGCRRPAEWISLLRRQKTNNEGAWEPLRLAASLFPERQGLCLTGQKCGSVCLSRLEYKKCKRLTPIVSAAGPKAWTQDRLQKQSSLTENLLFSSSQISIEDSPSAKWYRATESLGLIVEIWSSPLWARFRFCRAICYTKKLVGQL
jgi:hypothetical protein